jgi:hypothetical protein
MRTLKLCHKCSAIAVVTLDNRDYCALHGLEATMNAEDKGKKIIRQEEEVVKGVTKPN